MAILAASSAGECPSEEVQGAATCTGVTAANCNDHYVKMADGVYGACQDIDGNCLTTSVCTPASGPSASGPSCDLASFEDVHKVDVSVPGAAKSQETKWVQHMVPMKGRTPLAGAFNVTFKCGFKAAGMWAYTGIVYKATLDACMREGTTDTCQGNAKDMPFALYCENHQVCAQRNGNKFDGLNGRAHSSYTSHTTYSGLTHTISVSSEGEVKFWDHDSNGAHLWATASDRLDFNQKPVLAFQAFSDGSSISETNLCTGL